MGLLCFGTGSRLLLTLLSLLPTCHTTYLHYPPHGTWRRSPPTTLCLSPTTPPLLYSALYYPPHTLPSTVRAAAAHLLTRTYVLRGRTYFRATLRINALTSRTRAAFAPQRASALFARMHSFARGSLKHNGAQRAHVRGVWHTILKRVHTDFLPCIFFTHSFRFFFFFLSAACTTCVAWHAPAYGFGFGSLSSLWMEHGTLDLSQWMGEFCDDDAIRSCVGCPRGTAGLVSAFNKSVDQFSINLLT